MVAILIPAYKPDEKLFSLVSELRQKSQEPIVVVNDGNALDLELFSRLEKFDVKIVHHAVNRGKGSALKTGINFLLLQFPNLSACVTCDADGQHTAEDILRIASVTEKEENTLVIGGRTFDEKTPVRSRFGNSITRFVFRFCVGLKIRDTQTGLRGIPVNLMRKFLQISGDRYEYETNMLLFCKEKNIALKEIPIETIYIEENKSSHFNPLMDSLKIYSLIFKFGLSGIASSAIDFLVFNVVYNFSKILLASLIFARVISIAFNFFCNKNFVFRKNARGTGMVKTITKYLILAAALLCASFFGISFLQKILPFPVWLLKIITETILFFASYTIQRAWVFG